MALNGPSFVATFGYDGLGRHRTKTVNATRTDFLYDGLNPVQEGVLPGAITANLLTGLGIDEYLTRTDAIGARHFMADALGSTLALADGAGALQTEYTYEPFGASTTAGAASTNSFQYTGRENDGTGLYHLGARYYHPTLHRFISEDPLEFAGDDVNLYAYVWNNPLGYVDPWGLGGAWVIGGRGGIRFTPRQSGFRYPVGRYVRPRVPETTPSEPNPRPPAGRPLPRPPRGPKGGPEGYDPHNHAGHPRDFPHPPCPVDDSCIGPGGLGPITPRSPAPGGGRKEPPPPPCDPFYQVAGLCEREET